MHNLRFLLFTLSILIFGDISAQNTLISDDPAATTETSAVLNIHSDSKGLLIPRLDKVGRVSMPSPATGLVIFDTSDNIFYFFNGTEWERIDSGDKEFTYWPSRDVIRNIDHITADFILGDDRLPGSSAMSGEMLFFDNGKSAFRIGSLSNSNAWAPDSIGINSIGMGSNAKAIGDNAVSIGFENTASGDYSTVLGYYNSASGNYSTAQGYFNQAKGSFSQASGLATESTGQISTTMGNGTKADSRASMAIGQYNVGGGDPDNWVDTDPLFEIGNGTSYTQRENALTVLKNGNFILGSDHLPSLESITDTLLFYDQTKGAFRGGNLLNSYHWTSDSIGISSFAYGENTLASGKNSFSVGNTPEAKGDYSIALGSFVEASGYSSVAIGNSSVAEGNFSISMGLNTRAQSAFVSAFGSYNVGEGTNDSWIDTDPLFEIGNGINYLGRKNALTVLKNGSFILGAHELPGSENTSASLLFYDRVKGAFRGGELSQSDSWSPSSIGTNSFAYGLDTKASGPGSIAFGKNTTASNSYSTAFGWHSTASGSYATSMGYVTEASGTYSTAIGRSSKSMGSYSIAGGFGSDAIAESSIALGRTCTASGLNAVAIGNSNTASGYHSIALGFHTEAIGNVSTSMGRSTKADAESSTAIGRYNIGGGDPDNWVETDPLFEIGYGHVGGVNGMPTRKNALTVLKNGKIGVKTHIPEGVLHIKHDSDSSNPHLQLQEDGSDTDYTRLKLTNSTQTEYWNIAARPDDSALGSARFNIFYSDVGNIMAVYGNGNVRMPYGALMFGSVSTPGYRMHLPNSASPIEGQGQAYAWNTYSDARVKTNVKPTTYGLDEILSLNPVSYQHHSSEFKDGQLVVSPEQKETIGFIAQEVHQIIKEVVTKPENENSQLWSMDYEKLTPVLVKAIQEQQIKIELLEKTIENNKQEQQARVDLLEKKLEKAIGLVGKLTNN